MFLHVKQARARPDYRIDLVFNDGRAGTADLYDRLVGPVFGPLKDPALFAALRVDPELETVVWPNGADFAPEYLYFRAFHNDAALQKQFHEWGFLRPEARST